MSHWGERLIVIDSGTLRESFNDKSSLEFAHVTISVQSGLHVEYPFARNRFTIGRQLLESPCVKLNHLLVFSLDGVVPMPCQRSMASRAVATFENCPFMLQTINAVTSFGPSSMPMPSSERAFC